ncbi:fatty-acid--CoA ligase [Bordetella genomosp. 8]|uniref:Fatty-acid--CoA ligase n=1 Tax=Bordetella genomosp. 8 TaxID=1416806 RepID=A0A1W6YLG4_9BORD|nr:AMP-binding protein [Bordetella genomosp. 8]ARP81824.1 fatty-acid--CoA ligase [Bordetella genomosp. 8]
MRLLDDKGVPVPVTLPQVLDATERERSRHEAYVGPDERLSWTALRQESRRLAAALHTAGIGKGDHVGLMLGNSGLWIAAFFACASIGAVTVPVNTRFKFEELQFCLKQADVKLLLYADQFLGIDFTDLLRQVEPAIDRALPGDALPRLRRAVMVGESRCPAGVQALADFLAAGKDVPDARLDSLADAVTPHDVLLMQYTSGTTSFPKGVMLSHHNMLGDAAAVARRLGVTAEDRYFSIRPFYHVAGSTLSVLVTLVTGCCLLSLPKFDVKQTLDVLEAERCTLTSGNDTIFLMMMGHADFDPERLHLKGGWAAAGPEVMQKIRDVMRVPYVCNAYGQSEASPNVLVSDRDDAFELRRDGYMLPHPGVEVRLADPDTGVVIPPGAITGAPNEGTPARGTPARGTPARGEIQVRGWNVMRGYYNLPDATARAFTEDGWLRTGDLGEQRADGRTRMVGRLKDMFRVGGENVAPAEVEEILHGHPAVQMAQVIGVPDARLGEVAGAFVLLKPGQQGSCEELLAWCKTRCANFKVPRYMALVDTFEHIGMTGSSKVQKNKLREYAIKLWKIERDTVAS